MHSLIQECLRKSTPNLLFGDRFYHFDCALCSTGNKIGQESLTRLNMNWIEATHLVLFNLTVVNNKKYHDLESSVIPFFKRKFKSLQGPNSSLKSTRLELDFITELLSKNKTRFKCGSEIKKRSTFWGLRKVAPPSIPSRFAHLMSTSTTSTVNYKCKLDSKKLKSGQKSSNSTSIMPQPDSSLLKKPPVAKKRGRPAKNQQQKQPKLSRIDSLEQSEHSDADTNSSGRGTLDAFIPPPKNFEGFNNQLRNLGIGTQTPPSEPPLEASKVKVGKYSLYKAMFSYTYTIKR